MVSLATVIYLEKSAD